MATTTLLMGTAMTLIEGMAYVAVGLVHRRRTIEPAYALGAHLFVAFWLTIGINKILASTVGLLAAEGVVGFTLYLTTIQLNLLIVAISLAALVGYLSFILTGDRRTVVAAGILYAAFFVLLLFNVMSNRPTGVGVGSWRTYLVSEGATNPVLGLVVLAILIVPQVLLAVAVAVAVGRTGPGPHRRRAVLLMVVVIAWTTTAALIAAPGFEESALRQVASRVIGVAAAAVGLVAFVAPFRRARRPTAKASP